MSSWLSESSRNLVICISIDYIVRQTIIHFISFIVAIEVSKSRKNLENFLFSRVVTTIPHFCHFSRSSLQIPHSLFNWKRFIKLARCSIVCCPSSTLLVMSLFTFTVPAKSPTPRATGRKAEEVGWGRDCVNFRCGIRDLRLRGLPGLLCRVTLGKILNSHSTFLHPGS